MSNVPVDYRNDKVENWLLTYAYFHRKDYLISETEMLEGIPSDLLQTLPTRDHLLRIGWNLTNVGLLTTQYPVPPLLLQITDEGIFQFRKILQPILEKVRQEGNINKLIDSSQGDKQIKNQIKDFFKNNSNLPQDEFNDRLKDLVFSLGKEAVLILFRLMMAG